MAGKRLSFIWRATWQSCLLAAANLPLRN